MSDCSRTFEDLFRVDGYHKMSVISRSAGKDGDASTMETSHKADLLHQPMLDYNSAAHVCKYAEQSSRARADIDALLETEYCTQIADVRYKQQIGDDRLAIAIMAMYIFDFFWPVDANHKMLGKFWGSVEKVMKHDPGTASLTVRSCARSRFVSHIDQTSSRSVSCIDFVEYCIRDSR